VEAGEKVFLVGAFNGWKPQEEAYAMAPVTGQPGKFSISLTFPREAPDQTMIDTGSSFEYKFTKTTDTPTGDGWENGLKDFFTVDGTHPCTNFPGEAAGLFERSNLVITIEAADQELPVYVVPAWRNYAEKLGPYKTCT
jgi:hypothetical protein